MAGSKCLAPVGVYRVPAPEPESLHIRAVLVRRDASKRSVVPTRRETLGTSSNTTARGLQYAQVVDGYWSGSEVAFRKRWFRRKIYLQFCVRLQIATSKRHTGDLRIRPNKFDDVIHRRSGLKNRRYSAFL